MEKLDLKKTLKQIGVADLSKLVGKERLITLERITSMAVTDVELVKLLERRYKTQILGNKEVRNKLLKCLKLESLKYIIYADSNSINEITPIELKKIINMNWDRRTGYVQRIVNIFNLSDEYLPPKPIHLKSIEVLDVKKSLFPLIGKLTFG